MFPPPIAGPSLKVEWGKRPYAGTNMSATLMPHRFKL